MPLHQCPGPDRKRPVEPEEIKCPACGAEVELWTNETKAKCSSCSKVITRDQLDAKGK